MAVMTRAQFRRELQRGLNTVFGMEYRRWPQEWRPCFAIESSVKAYEEDVLLAGLGAAVVKPEGSGVTYDTGGEVWTASYRHETIMLAFAITEEAVEDGLYGNLGQKFSKSLARSLAHTKEVKGADIFNNGFNSSFAGGDGKELFATDHPLRSGATFSNELATPADLSEASLEDACIQIGKFVDDRGLQVMVRATTLLIPVDLEFEAERILKSSLRPGTADNDINAHKSMGYIPNGWMSNHYFTDIDSWFLKTDCPDGLKHFRRKKISRGMEGDFETGNMRYKARERYRFGWTDPRGAFGSAGAA